MDDDDRDLARHLFATMTALLEDAAELAAAGQSSRLDSPALAALGRRLQAAAKDIAAVAETAAIVADSGTNGPPDRRGRSR